MGSLVLGFLLLLGSSCTEEIIAEQQTAGGAASGDLVPVEFTVGDVANLTRATSSIVTFNANEQVKVCVKPNGQSSYTGYNYTTASAGHSDIVLIAPATPPYFPNGDNSTVDAYAYYPNNASTSFSVQADQRTDANYKASDLMYAANRTITRDVNDGSNSLLMNHLMAQLHLNVTGQGVSINRVLVNCKRSVTFTPEAQTVVSTTGSASDIVAMTGSGDAYVLIPQQPINTVTIKVETGSQNDASTTATFVFSYSSDFVAGKSYPLNLSVSATQLGITTSIADWDEMEAVNAQVGGGLDVREVSGTYTYDGSAKTPTPDVYFGTTKLTKDTDYQLYYINNINAGTATVCAIGRNTYASKVGMREFAISKATVANGSWSINKTSMSIAKGGSTNTIAVSRTGNGAVHAVSSDQSVATVSVSGTTVRVTSGSNVGSATITITVADGDNHTYAGSHTCTVTTTAAAYAGALNGQFTVNGTGKQVKFSKGNLQATYNGSSWTWAFAEHQWDFIGYAEGNYRVTDTPPYVAGYSGSSTTVDLFGWVGASSTWSGAAQYGITSSTTTDNTDGYGNVATEALKSDWGNTIGSGWRTLTSDEWMYLFNTRTPTSGVRYAKATVNGKSGVILLPDDWNTTYYSLTSINTANAAYTTNSITSSDWTNKLEAHGAVFLPAAGYRNGSTVNNQGPRGHYWSSSPNTSNVTSVYYVFFNSGFLEARNTNRNYGHSVRLVRQVE